jgi:hypothetical protein
MDMNHIVDVEAEEYWKLQNTIVRSQNRIQLKKNKSCSIDTHSSAINN